MHAALIPQLARLAKNMVREPIDLIVYAATALKGHAPGLGPKNCIRHGYIRLLRRGIERIIPCNFFRCGSWTLTMTWSSCGSDPSSTRSWWLHVRHRLPRHAVFLRVDL